ncbi:tight junction protein ZO-3 isoform X1 [Python bivittatus]|uniref:Tight junction protein ZO-3 isoform X1 n=2 Tax=Python bivittatus TaxID=176946 RepID=A0A9F2WFH1_PYTBI|nr:tight junction protein ZO-3 isoform X1 [Python bivittatus]
MAVRFQVAEMEEMIIWEQYTITLNRDPRKGFGIAISGGRDRPNSADGDTSIVISDVVPGGPAVGRLQTRDKIAMVNGLSMENVSSSFAISTLKTCGKLANITVKRPRKIHLPVAKPSQPRNQPSGTPTPHLTDGRNDDSDEDYGDRDDESTPLGRHPGQSQRRTEADRGYDGDSSSERSSGHYRDDDNGTHRQTLRSRRRSQEGGHRKRNQDSGSDRPPFANGHSHKGSTSGLALMSGFKRLPKQDVPMKPVRSVLVKRKESEEYGLKLGSQIFIKHITESGLAAKDNSLQEGDLILKINGIVSENMSLGETRQLIEQSEGKLTLLVLRDNSQFLVNIPQVRDSDTESSHLDDISDLGSDISPPPPVASLPHSPESLKRDSVRSQRGYSREEMAMEELTSTSIPNAEEPPSNGYDSQGNNSIVQSGGNLGYSPDSKVVRFVKAKNIGLRLAGGNDVGIFVAGVQEGSPAEIQGIQEGDQILQVNERPFQNVTREDAVQYLMELPPGEEVMLHVQNKQDIYKKMVRSNVGDSFYIRTHFDFEKDAPSGLSFTRGEVFHVVDTMYRGKLGSWLALRMGKELQELDKGIIPNQSRAEQISSLESVLKATSRTSSVLGARAEFWKLRGLRGAKRALRKSREDLSTLTKQGHYPPYEKVVLKEATFKRPVVILGPIADIAMQKLSTEMPDQFQIAESVSREGGSAKVIKLDTVWQIAKQDKHALLDITPAAVERLNYVQYFPIVVFCEPDSRQGIKAMRQWLAPDSKKSSRRLFAQANKMRKYCSHLFTATISLAGGSNSWYQTLKDIVQIQQARPVWMTEEQVDASAEESLDILNQTSAISLGDLTCDSRANSDYEETDAEGEPYTDQELEEPYQEAALSRSSEPAEQSLDRELNERVAAALAYPIDLHDGDHQPQGQWQSNYDIREYEHEALRKKFTHAQSYDSESDQDYGYDWGPATDL